MSAAALLVIDMQRDFVEPGAPAAVAGAPGCIAPINREAARVRDEGGTVVWVTRSYAADGSNVEPSRLESWRRDPFVVTGTPGEELDPRLAVAADDLRLVKPRFSSFFETDLDRELEAAGVEEILVAGVDLARCVRATVIDGLSLGYSVTVLAEATATRSPRAHAANLEDLEDLGSRVARATAGRAS
jgi:nicotinamidase-related amidase